MYDFEPRLPVDHVLAAVRLVRSENFSVAELLKLIGASVGEVGALMSQGPIFGVVSSEELTVEEAIAQLESVEFSTQAADPNFDPTPWIPIILKIIEWLIERRRG